MEIEKNILKKMKISIPNPIFTISVLSVLLLLTSSFVKLEKKVFICKGKSSKKYHLKKNCRGLSNCSTDTFEVTLTKAKELKRTLCGWED